MIYRVTAKFETPDLAELAIKRVKESVQSVYSANMVYNKMAERAKNSSRRGSFSIIPTYYNTHTNFLTAVMETPAFSDTMPEPVRNTQTSACIVCESAAVDNVIAILNAMGGLEIRSAH